MIRFAPGHTLVTGRAHEFVGRARRTLALRVAAATEGPVLWIAPAWGADRPCPDGMSPMLEPGRLIYALPHRAPDLLWCCEEALRSGAVGLVVADLPEPPGLTPVRRLHLAAAHAGGGAVALLLTPQGASPGVESRWSLTPSHTPHRTGWTLERLRSRTAPEGRWPLAPLPGTDPLD